MITQFRVKSTIFLDFIVPPRTREVLPHHPFCATSLDYGFDHDELVLGQELLAAELDTAADQPGADIDADEFDALYKWFIS